MDPLATAAEIATLLQVAEAVPQLQQRHASRKERKEAYLEYQRQVHKLMAGANHLSLLSQIRTTTLSTSVVAAIPMIGPFIDIAMPDRESDNKLIRALQEVLRNFAILTKAASPSTPPTLATVHEGTNQLRNQVLIDVGKVNDSLAAYLTALGELRLVGRPGPVRASGPINSLLQELFSRIPAPDHRALYERLVARERNRKSGKLDKFNDCLDALGKANAQFMSEIRGDKRERGQVWQIWRNAPSTVASAKELLSGDRDGGTE